MAVERGGGADVAGGEVLTDDESVLGKLLVEAFGRRALHVEVERICGDDQG